MRIVVVLPAPLGPSSPTTWPFSARHVTSSTARCPSAYVLTSPSTTSGMSARSGRAGRCSRRRRRTSQPDERGEEQQRERRAARGASRCRRHRRRSRRPRHRPRPAASAPRRRRCGCALGLARVGVGRLGARQQHAPPGAGGQVVGRAPGARSSPGVGPARRHGEPDRRDERVGQRHRPAGDAPDRREERDVGRVGGDGEAHRRRARRRWSASATAGCREPSTDPAAPRSGRSRG